MTEFITEELCKIIKEDDTFFNPAQKLNRDISIEVIKAFFPKDKPIRILGAMSATGIREIRYLQEVENSQVFFNDISKESIATIQKNLKLNGFNKFTILDENVLKKYNSKEFNDMISKCSDKYENNMSNTICDRNNNLKINNSQYDSICDINNNLKINNSQYDSNNIRYQDLPNDLNVKERKTQNLSERQLSCNISEELSLNTEELNIPEGQLSNIVNNRIFISQSDCRLLMSKYEGCFDVIDIDPFGSCALFINDAFKAIKHNGLLFLTCTDKASLCANEKKCFVRYGSKIKKNYAKNEITVRTLLSFISREVSKYDASIVPILSLSVDFYVRVIVQIKKRNGKSVINNNSYFSICDCLNNKPQGIYSSYNDICDVCNNKMKWYGLFWNKCLYNKIIIDKIYNNLEKNEQNNKRLLGIIRLIQQELDVPFYYELPLLCSKAKISSCKIRELMNALANSGYQVSLVYYDNNSIKTNAPLSIIYDLLKNNDKYNFENNKHVDIIFSKNYYKGLIASHLKPLSYPTKNI